MLTRDALIVLMLAALSGCRSQDSAAIADSFSSSEPGAVDLSATVQGNWDRVCVLGPYTNNQKAAQTLGFAWAVETLTDVYRNDGISVLVFVRGDAVLKHVEHSRGSGDFSNLSGRCFPRDRAKFVHVARPVKGLPGLFPADEA